MSEQDFQIIITNDDYQKLKGHEAENKKLVEENKKLVEQISSLKQKNKDLNRSVYVRDSFIDYMVNQCDYAFGTMLNMAIISSDITQSFYQDVVSHEQNGTSSIQLREAMELFIQKNKRIFDRLNDAQSKFKEMEKKIIVLESKPQQKKQQSKIKQPKPQVKVEVVQKNNTSNSDIKNKAKQLDKYTHQIDNIRHDIQKLKQQREKLDKQTQRLKNKNLELNKQNQNLNRKRETQGEKSYVIKLLVDQYYGQLERNLIKMGGLTDTQIGTVVANQMKGIIHYINNLAKKASRP